jgi:hypothetical protein
MDSDDIPMADESPVPVADSRNPLQQAVVVALPQNKFSIDVLSGKTDGEAKIVVNTSADPEHSDMFECDEELVLARLKALYPHVDIQAFFV